MQGLFVKKSKICNYRNELFNYSVLLGVTTLVGGILGALIMRSNGGALGDNYLTYLLQSFLNSHKSGSFFQVMSFSFLTGLILIILSQLSAFCCIGFIIIPVMPLLKGMFFGCLSSYLYSNFGAKGAFLNIILFWIPQVIQAIMLVYISAVAVDASLALFYNTFLGQKQGITAKYKRCAKAFVFAGLGLLFTAIIESSLASIFAFALM